MEPFKTLQSRVIPLVRNDVDTDQIIPARYLKVTDKRGLGKRLFANWRYLDGAPRPDFVLNRPEHQESQVLLAGDNFGCGSSREHAPWALVDWGIRAIIATSFADIFGNNALKNGLLPIAVDEVTHRRLQGLIEADPGAEVVVSVIARSLGLPDGSEVEFALDDFATRCLSEGMDELGYILSFAEDIARYEREHDQQDQ